MLRYLLLPLSTLFVAPLASAQNPCTESAISCNATGADHEALNHASDDRVTQQDPASNGQDTSGFFAGRSFVPDRGQSTGSLDLQYSGSGEPSPRSSDGQNGR